MAVNQILRCALESPYDDARYAYIAPYRWQAKEIAWTYIHRYADPIPGRDFNEAELSLRIPPRRSVHLFGAENYDALRGPYLDGAVLDEYAFTSPQVFPLVIRPQLSDRKGWALFLGTPAGRNHYRTLFEKASTRPGAIAMTYRASETGVIDPAELDDIRRDLTPEQYAQEYECSWDTPMQGAVYGAEINAARIQGRVREFKHDPALPVETWWDLGHTDATAIIFTQQVDREIRIIDYLEDERKDLAFYAKALQAKDYDYVRDHLPFDAGAKRLEGGGQSIEQQWRALRPRAIGLTVHARGEVQPGLHQARLTFPRCYFATPAVDRLLEALESYHYEWDRKRNLAKPEPDHDWSSHAADAFRLMATQIRRLAETGRTSQRYAETKWDKWGGYDKVSAGQRVRGSLS